MIMKTAYLDTNIYIDYFLNRIDKLRPLGDFAFNLIKKIVIGEYKLIISDLVILELEHNGFEVQTKTYGHGIDSYTILRAKKK